MLQFLFWYQCGISWIACCVALLYVLFNAEQEQGAQECGRNDDAMKTIDWFINILFQF